jgi:hypothetical protein
MTLTFAKRWRSKRLPAPRAWILYVLTWSNVLPNSVRMCRFAQTGPSHAICKPSPVASVQAWPVCLVASDGANQTAHNMAMAKERIRKWS